MSALFRSQRPSHPDDGITISGSIRITPPVGPDEIELLATIAIVSLRSAWEGRPSALVDQLAPAHPDGPSGWVACESGCCLEPAEGIARVDAIEPWLRYIAGTLLADRDLNGALVIYDHADRSFSALTLAGAHVRRRHLLDEPRSARASKRGPAGSGPRLVSSV